MTQGSGLINIPKAAQTDVLVKPNNVSFGLIKPNSGKVKLTQNITLQNLSSKKKSFSTRVELLDTNTKTKVKLLYLHRLAYSRIVVPKNHLLSLSIVRYPKVSILEMCI